MILARCLYILGDQTGNNKPLEEAIFLHGLEESTRWRGSILMGAERNLHRNSAQLGVRAELNTWKRLLLLIVRH